jgi:hypothetical protein
LIDLSLSAAHARVSFIDAGRQVMDRDVGALGPGRHLLRFGDGRSLRPGLYFIRLEQGPKVVNRRVCVLR